MRYSVGIWQEAARLKDTFSLFDLTKSNDTWYRLQTIYLGNPRNFLMAQYIEEGPEVVSSESLPEVYYSSLGKEVADPVDEGNVQFILLRSRPRWFWLCLVAVFVILAAAVGGGVGGTRASKHDPK